MKSQMIRVISSPSSSTTGLATLIFDMGHSCDGDSAERGIAETGASGKSGMPLHTKTAQRVKNGCARARTQGHRPGAPRATFAPTRASN